MALPNLVASAPIYTATLPILQKKVSFRPFLVAEEKLLLMAVASKETETIIQTTLQVIEYCLQTDIDINSLPFLDIDYLFIAMRAKSVAENIEITFKCEMIPPGQTEKCGTQFPALMDITNIEIEGLSGDMKIELSNGVGMIMKYPSYPDLKRITVLDNAFDNKIAIIKACASYIYDKDQIFDLKDYDDQQFQEFIGGLSKAAFDRLIAFTENLPSFYVKSEADCPKCGFHHEISYRKMDRFFFILMGYDNLSNYYHNIFQMVHGNHYSLADINNMIPWEKHVYVDMINEEKKRQN